MVREQHRWRTGEDAREEGHTVLRVDDHVWFSIQGAADGAAAEACCEHGEPGAHVDGIVAAGAGENDTIAHRTGGCVRVTGGAENYLVPFGGEVGGHALEVAFTAATFGVASVAPTQQKNFHNPIRLAGHRSSFGKIVLSA